MRKIKSISVLILSIMMLMSCNRKKEQDTGIIGLWEVTEVSYGGNKMTPMARWVRLNSDFSQESGNGWLQHSVGKWTLDPTTNLLHIENTNGLEDKIPFKVSVNGENMRWERLEEGEELLVTLKRITKLPTSEANKLFGLWKFHTIKMDNKEVSDSLNPSSKAMLFLRWDHNYELRNYPKGEKYGIFKTHGHRQRMQMVMDYNTEHPKIEFYNYTFKEDTLSLESTNKDFKLKLIRIHQFLK